MTETVSEERINNKISLRGGKGVKSSFFGQKKGPFLGLIGTKTGTNHETNSINNLHLLYGLVRYELCNSCDSGVRQDAALQAGAGMITKITIGVLALLVIYLLLKVRRMDRNMTLMARNQAAVTTWAVIQQQSMDKLMEVSHDS